jgi:hypothetical protein
MAKRNVKPASPSPIVIAPLRDGRTVVVLDHDAIVLDYLMPAKRVSKWDAAGIIVADYPCTARPGCNPNRAVASGTIVCK